MSTEVLVPPLGQTVDTVTLVTWYKQEGETVVQGEPLFAIETDKATLDVEAPASGVLHGVTAQPGDAVQALRAIAVIGEAPSPPPPPPILGERSRKSALGAASLENLEVGGKVPPSSQPSPPLSQREAALSQRDPERWAAFRREAVLCRAAFAVRAGAIIRNRSTRRPLRRRQSRHRRSSRHHHRPSVMGRWPAPCRPN
jgi:pyruvate/2-oxoglutarate dehydrogenase complex dihydrolipoamide acyltransferase (E2) component